MELGVLKTVAPCSIDIAEQAAPSDGHYFFKSHEPVYIV